MSATNSTTNYSLPLFVPTDKPAWLVDWNGAMSAIDTAIKQAQTAADIAGTDIGTLQGDIVSINAALTSVNSAVSQLRLDTNSNTGAINTIQELIGNGTPVTTDKTIIGAINEIYGYEEEIYTLDDVTPNNITISSVLGTVDTSATSGTGVKSLQTAHNKLLKFFGSVTISNLTFTGADNPVIATVSNTGLTIPNEFVVSGMPTIRVRSGDVQYGRPCSLRFKTNGDVDIFFQGPFGSSTFDNIQVSMLPCLLVNSSIE